jgi:hypothetical protein
MGELTGRAERTVRNWGDPDTPDSVPMDCAIALDLAYQRAGGEDAPIHDVYELLLKTGREDNFADEFELSRRAGAAIKESGEAAQAQIACTLPGATAVDHEVAIRETEEAITAHTNTLALLRKGAGSFSVERATPGGETT